MPIRDIQQVETDLVNQIEKSRKIIDGLENNDAFKALLADFKEASDSIDSVWHLEQDEKRLQEMRITKLAAQSLLTILDSYKFTLNNSKKQLEKIREEDEEE